jgi:hypothetical protein
MPGKPRMLEPNIPDHLRGPRTRPLGTPLVTEGIVRRDEVPGLAARFDNGFCRSASKGVSIVCPSDAGW